MNWPSIVLLGDSEVGKSSLYSNFFERKFCKEYIGTVEEKYVQEVIVGNAMKKIRILDTSGDVDYYKMVPYWIESGNCFILVYSTNEETTLTYLTFVYNLIQNNEKAKKMPIFFVGNKCDLARKVFPDDVKILFGKKISLFETSANSDDDNVDQAFNNIFSKFFEKKKKFYWY